MKGLRNSVYVHTVRREYPSAVGAGAPRTVRSEGQRHPDRVGFFRNLLGHYIRLRNHCIGSGYMDKTKRTQENAKGGEMMLQRSENNK